MTEAVAGAAVRATARCVPRVLARKMAFGMVLLDTALVLALGKGAEGERQREAGREQDSQ